MKKAVIYPVTILLVLIFSAGISLGMQPLSDSEMETTVASSGVDIAINDAQYFISQQGIWYKDTDGMSPSVTSELDSRDYSSDQGASIGFDGFEFSVNINAITSYDPSKQEKGGLISYDRGLQGAYKYTLPWEQGESFEFRPITIDVASGLPGMATVSGSTDAGMVIGVSTMEIVTSSFETDFKLNDNTPLDGTNNLNAANKDKSFFGYEFGGATTTTLRGNLEMSPH